ncbi:MULTISPECIES: imidazole glycerol phosphate synthase subunit HisH [Sanguibacteroides]|uniref:Imidazole glycerol phosphate synthase subunit HisH n=1 Tax=Sanguibacteroides justesenii TaxID=1547597 RepID=A0AB34RA36_9PORP|nr:MULTISPECIES: imidazole glycerol phosphate synthase subunit HisH [Sanguibacteroides]KIO47000.1 imidazole glycerol phosphate synthase [Sanguibacteroides justesenii]PXZ43618.1 imidazole glycerol phosphate synthase subunit HisH [Sanguibacteroides justesenii]
MVTIIDYGAGNVFSVQTALRRLGEEVVVSSDPEVVCRAERVIFPGVGQAATAMEQLREKGLDKILPGLKVPVLGICLGMQLMCTFSEEGDTTGLGIFPLEVKQMKNGKKIPHMGWNRIYGLHSDLFRRVREMEWSYFVHSYYLPCNEYQIAGCDYGGEFCAAVRKENFWGCQFHPEKSSAMGEMILRNFLMF